MEQERERPTAHFVHLVTLGDVSEARILAALLEGEGIEVRVHSEALGPYPVTVGQMAVAELWVMEDRLEDAQAVLGDAELAGAADEDDPAARRAPTNREIQMLAILLIAAFVLAVVLRLMRVF